MMRRLAMPTLPGLYGSEKLPGFELTYISAGATFRAFVRARNTQSAAEEGLIELAQQCPDFELEGARLVAALQVQ
jgi:hypothetical protein